MQDSLNEIARSQFRIEKYNDRNWAVFEGNQLVCVAVYKRGAREVCQRLLKHSANDQLAQAAKVMEEFALKIC